MKKRVFPPVWLLLVFTCVLFAACGSGGGGSGGNADLSASRYVGTWKARDVTLMDQVGEFDSEILLTLNADGTATFVTDAQESACTWEETEGGFRLRGGAKMTFTDDGEGIRTSLYGIELRFERQD